MSPETEEFINAIRLALEAKLKAAKAIPYSDAAFTGVHAAVYRVGESMREDAWQKSYRLGRQSGLPALLKKPPANSR